MRPRWSSLPSAFRRLERNGWAGSSGSVGKGLLSFPRGDMPVVPFYDNHADIYGWNPSSRPGRPEGGEAQAVRALYALIAGGGVR